ncbi:MAG: SGNH/GDSL hydrolase family protein [Polyangiaceae bacterium]
MQKSRRWSGLELNLLSLSALLACSLAACGGQAPAASAPPPATTASAPPVSAVPAPAVPPAPGAVAPPDAAAPGHAPVTPQPAAAEPLPKGTLVLQMGDSFAAALGIELGKRLKAEGVRSALEYKTASYIPNWSYDGDIPKYVAKYHPDLVLITLGANEIEIPKPDMRAGPIRHLVSELGGRPCVWVAPPLWKPDTGLLKVIRENIAPCRYLDSNALVHDLPRGHDEIHPSTEGREIWAKIVFDWLVAERVGTDKQPWALKPEPVAN